MRSRDWPHVQTNFAKQMTFKLPTTLVNHLEQEIYEKLESAVELRAAEWNGDWAAREQRGEKNHFYMVNLKKGGAPMKDKSLERRGKRWLHLHSVCNT